MISREGTDMGPAHCPKRDSSLGRPPWAWPGRLSWVCRGAGSPNASVMHFCSCLHFNPLPKVSTMQPFKTACKSLLSDVQESSQCGIRRRQQATRW